MIAAMLLAAALVWLFVAFVAGSDAYRWRQRRWHQIVVTVFVLWLPFWDVLPGYVLYRMAVQEHGGLRIYRTERADGYLDLTATDCVSCWSELRSGQFQFVEVYRSGYTGLLQALEHGSGYYTYRLLPSDDSRCAPFDMLPNAQQIRALYLPADRCVASAFGTSPVSRYALRAGVDTYGHMPGFWPITLSWRRVADRASGDLLAESVQVRYASWLARKLSVTLWSYSEIPGGRHVEFRIEEVLVPT